MTTPRAAWDRIANTQVDTLGFSSTQPQYWSIYLRFPTEHQLVHEHIHYREHKRRLIEVSYTVEILKIDFTAVNSTGILAAELYAGEFAPSQLSAPPFSIGTTPPGLDPNANLVLDATTFQSTPLPISGVNFPIWTQAFAGPLKGIVDLDDLPFGPIWGTAFIQVNGFSADASAVTTRQKMTWDIPS